MEAALMDNLADRCEQRLVATRGSLLPGFSNLFEDYRGSMFDARTVGDELLVLAAKRGDHCAFEMLVYRHRAKMLRTAMRFTHNTADTEDVVQVGFQKAFFRRSAIAPPSRVGKSRRVVRNHPWRGALPLFHCVGILVTT